MTNPFASPFASAPVATVEQSTVDAANARDYSAPLPSFSFGAIPETAARSFPNRKPTPEMAQYAEPFLNFEPLNPAHHVVFGFTGSSDQKVNDATAKRVGKVTAYLRKKTGGAFRLVQRTVVHPEDVTKPLHEQRKVVVGWRNHDAELSK